MSGWLRSRSRNLTAGLYAELKNRSKADAVPDVVDQISKDLVRLSLPTNLTAEHHERIREALRAVLIAYSLHDSAVGYCQGMHCVAASALLPDAGASDTVVLADEENAFSWLDMVVHEILPRAHLPGLPGLLEEQALLARLLQEQKPLVHAHFEGL